MVSLKTRLNKEIPEILNVSERPLGSYYMDFWKGQLLLILGKPCLSHLQIRYLNPLIY